MRLLRLLCRLLLLLCHLLCSRIFRLKLLQPVMLAQLQQGHRQVVSEQLQVNEEKQSCEPNVFLISFTMDTPWTPATYIVLLHQRLVLLRCGAVARQLVVHVSQPLHHLPLQQRQGGEVISAPSMLSCQCPAWSPSAGFTATCATQHGAIGLLVASAAAPTCSASCRSAPPSTSLK